MMKKLSLLMTAIMVTAMSFADVTYQLNGGVTNDYGWQSKSDMFAAFMTDAGATDFESLDYYLQQTNPVGLIRNKMNNAAPALSMTDKWGWLKTYIETVTEEYNTTSNGTNVTLSSDGSGTEWCYAVGAFFCNMHHTIWPFSADFTQAGLPEAFQPTWKHGFCNPATVAEGETWTLNAPYKEGQSFYGWFDNATLEGSPVTEITSATRGSLYAIFVSSISEAKTLDYAVVSGVVNYIQWKTIYIQDTTGGICVWTPTVPTCTIGQRITVKGSIKEYYGAPEVSGAEILSISDAELYEPIQFETLGMLKANALEYFGKRVHVSRLQIASYKDRSPFVTDGIDTVQCYRMPLDETKFPIGKQVDITAIAGYYDKYVGQFQFVGDSAGIVALNATDYYFAGEASGWSEKNESFKFVEESGVLTLHVADLYGEFKITENATWHPQHGGAYEGEVAKVELNKPYTLTKEIDGKGDPKNVAFALEENYHYKDATLTLDATNPDALVITLVSGFAAPENTPTKADLADYYQAGQLCICIYFEEQVCNDIVFAGSYNGWATDKPTEMAKFEPVEGFDGWYVVAVTDASEDIQGKPVQLQSDGTFSWDYQTGDADSWTMVSGTVTIEPSYSGEANLKGYSTAEPVIMISKYFKNHRNPCIEETRHNYTVNLKAPICADAEGNYFAPAIIGSFNSWSEGVPMTLNEETMIYSYTFSDRESGEFKFKAAGDTDWSNQVQILGKNPETGEYEWQDNPNILLGTTEVIDIDYSTGKYTLCVDNILPGKTLPYQESFRIRNDEWSYGNWSIGHAGYSFAEDHAYFNIYGGNSATLISPRFDLRDIAAGKPVTLSFDLALTAYSGAEQNTPPSDTQNQTFAVFVSADGADYTTQPNWIWSNDSQYHTYAAIPVKGETYELDLSDMAGKMVRIAFFAHSTTPTGDNYLNLRNMKIDTVPMTPTHHVRFTGYNLFVNYRDNLNNEHTLTELTSFNIDVHHGSVLTIREDAFCAEWNGWSDGESNRARTITVTSDTTLAALFTDHSVRIVAGENGYLDTGDIIGKANGCDVSSINVCAYANEGYYFDSWSDGVTTQCRWFYFDSNIDVTARFAAKKQVSLTVGTAPQCTAMGSTAGSCIAETGDIITITAVPNTGYHFVEWSDGDATPTRDIYLRSDSTLLATFAEGTYGGKCGDNLYWVWDENTGALTITGTGWMDLNNYTTWKNYNININSVTFPEGMKSIAYQAFYGSNICSVVIPASVEYFGMSAFEYCRNLTRFEYLGDNAWTEYQVLSNGTRMTYAKAPAGVLNSIEYNIDTMIVTGGRMDMQRLYWQNSTYIDLSKATNTTIEGEPETMVYDNCRTLILPEGLESIGADALRGFMRLANITIPAGVTEIGRRAFEDCRSLQSVTFAGTALRTINDWAFYNCHNLRTLSLPEGLTTIGLAAFYGCSYLTDLTLPSTLQSIDDSGFGLCAKIQSISVRALLPPVIDAKTFEGVDRKITLAVPTGSKAFYIEAPYWQEFFNITEESTGSDSTTAGDHETVRKIVRNGQVLILRGGKTYTVTGIEVK